MAKKKSAKAGSKAKTKVDKGSVSLRELPGRHMRLTQEFDRLSTMVARQGQLLQGVYLVLQQAKLMPYAPEQMGLPVKDSFGVKPGKKIALEGVSAQGGRGHAFPISGRAPVPNKYDVVLKMNGQMLGYLTEAGTWTLDPKQIKTWILRDDAEATLATATVPEGAKAEIRGHS